MKEKQPFEYWPNLSPKIAYSDVIKLSFFHFFPVWLHQNLHSKCQIVAKEGTARFVLIAYVVHELLLKSGRGNIPPPSAPRGLSWDCPFNPRQIPKILTVVWLCVRSKGTCFDSSPHNMFTVVAAHRNMSMACEWWRCAPTTASRTVSQMHRRA